MTPTAAPGRSRPAPPPLPASPPRSGRRWPRAARLGEIGRLAPAAIIALAVVLRLVDIGRAYDINGDEVNYASLTLSLRHGHFPPRFDNAPFLLHPPGFFTLGALWGDLLGISGNYLHQLTALRVLDALIAGVSAALIYALGVRMAGRAVGMGAALIFALDPYILRQNERVMLETSTLALVLAGYLVLASVLEGRSRRPMAGAVTAGLLLGLAIVDKDVAAVLVVIPVGLLLRRTSGVDRRLASVAFTGTLVPYAIYVAGLTADGWLPEFLSQESLGLRRQLGLVQETGFNAHGSPSLFATALAQLGHYGPTYLISGLGIVASIYLLARHREPILRLWATVTLAGAVSLAYSVLFGTIEEQMLYFMYVPAVVALVAGLVLYVRQVSVADPVRNHRIRRAVAWAVVLFCAYDGFVWAQVRSTPDNGNARVIAWFASHAPDPGVIGTNTDVTTNLLRFSGFRAVDMPDPQTGAAHHVRYLTILSASLVGNYGTFNQAQAGFFEHYGRMVYSYHENTYGTISIWETTAPAIW